MRRAQGTSRSRTLRAKNPDLSACMTWNRKQRHASKPALRRSCKTPSAQTTLGERTCTSTRNKRWNSSLFGSTDKLRHFLPYLALRHTVPHQPTQTLRTLSPPRPWRLFRSRSLLHRNSLRHLIPLAAALTDLALVMAEIVCHPRRHPLSHPQHRHSHERLRFLVEDVFITSNLLLLDTCQLLGHRLLFLSNSIN